MKKTLVKVLIGCIIAYGIGYSYQALSEKSETEKEIKLCSLLIPIKEKDSSTLEAVCRCISPRIGGLLASNVTHYPEATVSSSFSHSIENFPQDNIIKIEDGSEWIFDKNNSHVIHNWNLHDTVDISPKGSWLWGSNYSYVMTNKNRGTFVDVNLYLKPIPYGSHSAWIVGIDQNNGQVYLLNGEGKHTVWEIPNVDLYLFKDWEINDTLIVGQNDSLVWWFSSYNHILINVDMHHFVRARQVFSNPYHRNDIRG